MLRPTEFEPLLDDRFEDRPRHPAALSIRQRRSFAFALRRRVGHALIALGRLVAAEPAPLRRSAQRRRAY